MEIKNAYNLIKELINDNLNDLSLLENELKRIDISMELKATIVLKISSNSVKRDDRMIKVLNFGIGMFETKKSLSCSDLLLCALASEKSWNFDKAIQYYTQCSEMLPISGLKYAVDGMKYRVLYKKENKPEDIGLCNISFENAYEYEENSMLKEKWKTALEEAHKYQNKKWE